ncbi:MAG: hypothetical protein ABIA76_04740 [Candidatus Diapherotrites archaeon]
MNKLNLFFGIIVIVLGVLWFANEMEFIFLEIAFLPIIIMVFGLILAANAIKQEE